MTVKRMDNVGIVVEDIAAEQRLDAGKMHRVVKMTDQPASLRGLKSSRQRRQE